MYLKSLCKISIIALFTIYNSLQGQKIQKVSMQNNLIAEVARHPSMKVEDLYKFIHQASFGSEHAVRDTVAVSEWMENEISTLDLSFSESMMDTLSSGGNLVRVNLRPWLLEGKDKKILLAAFIKTANTFHGTKADFMANWECAMDLAKNNYFKFSCREMDRFIKKMQKENLPAIHHSKKYEELYKPAYRVVDVQFLPVK